MKKLAVVLSLGFDLLALGRAMAADSTPVKVNRTIPLGDTPKTALQFSAVPTTEEIFRAPLFAEPLVPIGSEPTTTENAALAGALRGYAERSSPDDFSSLTDFLTKYPQSPWRAALLTSLGLEYYNTAHYSLALEAWREAWSLGQKATDAPGEFLADRAVCELASLYSRLGRMTELEVLLKSVEQRIFLGGANERINLAREALSMMQYQPGVSFRCGPLALQSILRSDQRLLASSPTNSMMEIFNSASTQQGFSLPQVAELSKTVGLNYQMAFREKGGEFVIPSVVHWKVGHYAALVRQEGDRYLLEDPTFGNTVWATKQALESETSGYFIIPPGGLPQGWRSVNETEGGTVWGKGVTSGIDPDNYTPEDQFAGLCQMEDKGPGWLDVLFSPVPIGVGMAVSRVHLGLANLQVRDTPVGYTPPVGPPVQFTVRYNHRDYIQPASAISRNFGPKWTHDWFAYIRDIPLSPLADVKYYVGGGGARTFTGFSTATQTFAPQQLEQTRLRRIGTNTSVTYEMTFRDGSKKVFGSRSGNDVLLTQVVDQAGNAVTLTWSGLRLIALTDAIGQVTTISYDHPSASGLITKVTDPFGRFATFDYRFFDLVLDPINQPTNVTRV
ncbi:MAG: cysteine peptidase family C39 domain-containing protein, partial [Verrucomicrobiota bacterium]